jgi:tetratricopeptide (TPR) repeat protein
VPGKVKSSRRLGAVVFIAALVTFAGTIGYGYVWDDPYLIGRIREAISTGEIPGLFTSSFYVKTVSTARYYRPVMLASLLGDITLTGGAPWFSHLVNILVHALNSTLVFLLFKKVLRDDHGALVGALLFAVIPVHAGSVAAVYNRVELMTLALLLPMVLYWTGSEEHNGPQESRFLPLSLLSFFLACLTKETAFMLPAVLFGWEAVRVKRSGHYRLKDLTYMAFAAGAALLVRTTVFALERADTLVPGAGAGTLKPEASLTSILKILMVNMRLAVFPLPGRTHWAATDLSVGWITVLALLFFLLLIGLGFRMSPGSTSRGLVWWAMFTLPVVGIFNLGPVVATQRYVYIPSVGLSLIVGGMVASLPGRVLGRNWVKGLVLAAMIALGISAAVQAQVWKNEVTLFREVTGTNPAFANAHINLGVALAREGRYEEALQAYDKAQSLVPGWVDAAFNRGNLFYRMGRYEEALTDFDLVLKKEPDDWEASLNRGNVLAALGRNDEAARSYRDAMAANASSGKPLVGLGVLAARDGEFTRAVRLFTDAARREPVLTEAYEGLGGSYLAMGMHGMAEDAFLKALEISPGNTRAAMKLGWFLLGTGRPVKAENAFRTALEADPFLLEAWVGLVRSLDAAGEKSKADELIKEMGRTDPTLADGVIRSREGGSSQSEGR